MVPQEHTDCFGYHEQNMVKQRVQCIKFNSVSLLSNCVQQPGCYAAAPGDILRIVGDDHHHQTWPRVRIACIVLCTPMVAFDGIYLMPNPRHDFNSITA